MYRRTSVCALLLMGALSLQTAGAQSTPAETQRVAEAADREDRGEWGWLGLIGLAGLLGLKRRDREDVRRDHATVTR